MGSQRRANRALAKLYFVHFPGPRGELEWARSARILLPSASSSSSSKIQHRQVASLVVMSSHCSRVWSSLIPRDDERHGVGLSLSLNYQTEMSCCWCPIPCYGFQICSLSGSDDPLCFWPDMTSSVHWDCNQPLQDCFISHHLQPFRMRMSPLGEQKHAWPLTATRGLLRKKLVA